MRRVDEVPQLGRRSVGRLGREERGRVVAPGAVPRVLLNGQGLRSQLKPISRDVAELALDLRERRPVRVVLVAAPGEGADVELVDQEVLERAGGRTAPTGSGPASGTIEALRLVGSLRVSSELSTSRAAGVEPLEDDAVAVMIRNR